MKMYSISIRISPEPHILKWDIGAAAIDTFPKDLSKQKEKSGEKQERLGEEKRSKKLEEETKHLRFKETQPNLKSWKNFTKLVNQVSIAANS